MENLNLPSFYAEHHSLLMPYDPCIETNKKTKQSVYAASHSFKLDL